jgi:hypothetical protein
MQQVSTTTDKGNLLGGIDNCSSAWYKGLESFGQQVLVTIFLHFNWKTTTIFTKNISHIRIARTVKFVLNLVDFKTNLTFQAVWFQFRIYFFEKKLLF